MVSPTPAEARPVIVFVPCIGRSGTSALTRVLSLCGAALPPNVVGRSRSAPRGSWEPRAALTLNNAILRRHGTVAYDPSLRFDEEQAFDGEERAKCIAAVGKFLATLPAAPLVVIKEGQIAMLSGVWFEAARLAGFDVAAAITVRHPQEVIPSLAKHINASPELSAALWLKYNLLSEKHTRGVPRVFVDYANLLDDWRREIGRVAVALGIDLSTRDEGAVEEFLAPELRHQKDCSSVTEYFGTDWMSTVWEAERAAANDKPFDELALDDVYKAYRASESSFQTAVEDYHAHLKSVRVNGLAPVNYLVELVAKGLALTGRNS